MAYDGFYSGLSDRASVSELLNQALQAKDVVTQASTEVLAAASAVTADKDATNLSKLAAEQAAAAAAQDASETAEAKELANRVLDNYLLRALYRFYEVPQGANVVINPNTAAVQRMTLNVPLTEVSVSFNANTDEAMTLTLIVRQGTGANKVNWSNIVWANGVPPALSYTAGKEDVIALLVSKGANKVYGFYMGSGL